VPIPTWEAVEKEDDRHEQQAEDECQYNQQSTPSASSPVTVERGRNTGWGAVRAVLGSGTAVQDAAHDGTYCGDDMGLEGDDDDNGEGWGGESGAKGDFFGSSQLSHISCKGGGGGFATMLWPDSGKRGGE
jgi:hypothetical protein